MDGLGKMFRVLIFHFHFHFCICFGHSWYIAKLKPQCEEKVMSYAEKKARNKNIFKKQYLIGKTNEKVENTNK